MSQNISSFSPRLSIVIPARNEFRRLPGSLEKIAQYLSTQAQTAELIVVDNGSTDGTGDVVREFAEFHRWLPTRLIEEPVTGKGAAVRTGMLAANGEMLFQCDADLSMPIHELDKLLRCLNGDTDIVIGSREGQGVVRIGESLHRRAMGRFFNLIVKLLGLSGLPDTQCGFKVFRRAAARELFSLQTITGWGFDVEILVLARELNYSIASAPINWTHDHDSRVCPFRDGFAMLREVLTIRQRLKKELVSSKFKTCEQLGRRLELDAIGALPKIGTSLSLNNSSLSLRRVA